MKVIHPHIRFYVLGAIIAILIGCVFLMIEGKVSGHLYVNSLHSSFLDFFFKYYTHVGGGTFVILGSAALSALFWKRYQSGIALLALFNLLLVAASTQLLKQIVFSDAFRPIKFIGKEFLYTIPGVEMHTNNSFPSGHTAAGFAFFALVAFLFGTKKWIQLLCVVGATLVGLSRIYLSQHFLEDTVLGAAIGITCFLLSYVIVKNLKVGKSLNE
ncbi:MAG: phosphatase PAP2 family protein [Crocinitomicaceae bacterium]